MTHSEYNADLEKRGSYGGDHRTEVNLIYLKASSKKSDVRVSGGEATHIYSSSFSEIIRNAGEGEKK